MKITKEDRKDQEKKYEMPITDETYPYGLQVNLEEMSIKKLGMEELPEVGKEMILVAKVDVTSVSNRKDNFRQNRNVSLQITDMELKEQVKNRKSSAENLYGS